MLDFHAFKDSIDVIIDTTCDIGESGGSPVIADFQCVDAVVCIEVRMLIFAASLLELHFADPVPAVRASVGRSVCFATYTAC